MAARQAAKTTTSYSLGGGTIISTRQRAPRFFLRRALTILGILASLLVFASSATAHDFGPCKLKLNPPHDVNPLGANHTVTAQLTIRGGNQHETAGAMCARNGGGPAVGRTINFVVIGGPNTGKTGSGVTNGSGNATWTYTSSLVGTDTIKAWYSEPSCATQLDYDDQTLLDCPPGQLITITVQATATKRWFDPYACNPYYTTCSPGGAPPHKPKKHVVFKFGKKCKATNFRFTPKVSGGTVRWMKLTAGKKSIKKLTRGPFRFTVPVKKFKKGKKQKLKLTTLFTDGSTLVARSSIRRCR